MDKGAFFPKLRHFKSLRHPSNTGSQNAELGTVKWVPNWLDAIGSIAVVTVLSSRCFLTLKKTNFGWERSGSSLYCSLPAEGD